MGDVEALYQEFIYLRTYSRWLDDQGRRETWAETVSRYLSFMKKRVPKKHHSVFSEIGQMMLNKHIMGSMRALWTAGPALDKEHIAGYNCAYTVIDSIRSIPEILYILLCGTGVGYSVEQRYIEKLPQLHYEFTEVEDTIVFRDSKRGWAEGYYHYLRFLFDGKIPKYDLSKIRPKGARLKTFGGRASGPSPLRELLEFTRRTLANARGRRLTSLEVYDLVCWVANSVVVGGVRRSACICLSDLGDDRMAKAKVGDFYYADPQRSMSNISVAYTEKPSPRKFLSEWIKLMESRSGERGIFNRVGADYSAIATGRREGGHEWGCNPCGEILSRPYEFCNLSEVVIRPTDSLSTLKRKVKFATILGTIQSTLTNFKFINRKWKRNCEEERLLGVSLTGLMDHKVLNHATKTAAEWLHSMKETAIETAREWSVILGVPMPKAITCVKPSGTVSQLVGCSSGLHPRYSPWYIRRVRVSSTDPVCSLLLGRGFKAHPELGQDEKNPETWVFEFPIKSPETSRMGDEISAVDQLNYWLMLKRYWCEHNPSVTIYVREEEWINVADWVYRNWDMVCGLTFLPKDNNVYRLAPYEEIDEETYHRMISNVPSVNWKDLAEYENDDETTGSREYACVGGACEL